MQTLTIPIVSTKNSAQSHLIFEHDGGGTKSDKFDWAVIGYALVASSKPVQWSNVQSMRKVHRWSWAQTVALPKQYSKQDFGGFQLIEGVHSLWGNHQNFIPLLPCVRHYVLFWLTRILISFGTARVIYLSNVGERTASYLSGSSERPEIQCLIVGRLVVSLGQLANISAKVPTLVSFSTCVSW